MLTVYQTPPPEIQPELRGVHLQPYSVIQPSLSALSTNLRGEMRMFAWKIFLCSSSWTGRVGRMAKEELRLCHDKPKQARIQMLSNKRSWSLLIFSALWSKPSLTRDHHAKKEETLQCPVLAESVYLSWGSLGEKKGFQKDSGEEKCSSELWGAQVVVTQGDGAARLIWKVGGKCYQLLEWGILFWKHFSTWSIQNQIRKGGGQNEDVDEDVPAGTSYAWKKVLR